MSRPQTTKLAKRASSFYEHFVCMSVCKREISEDEKAKTQDRKLMKENKQKKNERKEGTVVVLLPQDEP
jgi:hypothetical protein